LSLTKIINQVPQKLKR